MDIPTNDAPVTLAQARARLLEFGEQRAAAAKAAASPSLIHTFAPLAAAAGAAFFFRRKSLAPRGVIGGLLALGLWASPKIAAKLSALRS